MQHGDWRRPDESLNDYCSRVDDEIRPHEDRKPYVLGIIFLLGLITAAAILIFIGYQWLK